MMEFGIDMFSPGTKLVNSCHFNRTTVILEDTAMNISIGLLDFHVRPVRKRNVGAQCYYNVIIIEIMMKLRCCARNRGCPLRSG